MSPKTDHENPEWTEAKFKRAKPASELPVDVLKAFPRTATRGPQKEPKKVPVSLRLSADVLEHFKSTGAGWQTRIDDTLRVMVGTSAAKITGETEDGRLSSSPKPVTRRAIKTR